MSLATRCPACGTTFKVVRDQLRISDGWVRCGRCSHVFDGAANLHEIPSGPAAEPGAEAGTDAVRPPGETEPSAPAPDSSTVESPPPSPAAPPESALPPDAPAAALADLDFFSDAMLHLHVGAPPPSGYAAAPIAPPPAITDHIPQPARTQPVALERPSLTWPAFTDYASAPIPVIEFPSESDMPRPQGRPQAAARVDTTWAQLPSLQLGDVAPGPRTTAAWTERASLRAASASAAEAPAPQPGDAEDAQLQKALRRARIKSLKIAKARAKAKENEAAPVVLAASEPVAEPLTQSPSVPEALHSTAAALRAAGAASVRGRRLMRWPWPTICVLAVLLLIVQWLYQERSAIVARQPSLRPAFASACEALGCQLPPLKQIADIAIDGASFARDKSGEGYQLSFTLRNRAATALAMPAIELALLDTQEQAVVRRVLQPAELGAPMVLAAHAERSTSLPVTLAGPGAAGLPRVAGFRLYPFYP